MAGCQVKTSSAERSSHSSRAEGSAWGLALYDLAFRQQPLQSAWIVQGQGCATRETTTNGPQNEASREPRIRQTQPRDLPLKVSSSPEHTGNVAHRAQTVSPRERSSYNNITMSKVLHHTAPQSTNPGLNHNTAESNEA